MTAMNAAGGLGWRTPAMVIVAGCVIAVLGFGVLSTFGLFLDPMTEARGWDTETFALAMAIQNLLWGLGAFAAGTLADRFGPVKVIVVGALAYTAGIYGMTQAESSLMLHLTGGILTGIAWTRVRTCLPGLGPTREGFDLSPVSLVLPRPGPRSRRPRPGR